MTPRTANARKQRTQQEAFTLLAFLEKDPTRYGSYMEWYARAMLHIQSITQEVTKTASLMKRDEEDKKIEEGEKT